MRSNTNLEKGGGFGFCSIRTLTLKREGDLISVSFFSLAPAVYPISPNPRFLPPCMESEMDLVFQVVTYNTSLYHNLWEQVLNPIWDSNVKPMQETRGIPLESFMGCVWACIVRIGHCQQPLFPLVGRYTRCAGQAQLLWTLLLQVPWHTQTPMWALWCSCLV